MDDNKIIELYFARDEQAISETKAKYGKYCLKIAYNVLGNYEDAEECENDTYLGVWNAIPPTRPQMFSAFIGRITRNLSLKKLRARVAEKRQGSEAVISLDELGDCVPDGQSFDEGLNEKELAEIISLFLRSLNVTERKVFVCRYWYCDPISDICSQFGFSQSKVKMMLLRTRQKLSTYLQERGILI
ncbi:MAG: sigma-70 family RNA polymerase sigma factor [Clostridia bacterium]|nr:sigma-70 family RNA polymerase sigma factor [Clostridia bacterium]